MAEQGSQGVFSGFLRWMRTAKAIPHLRGDVLDIGCGAGQVSEKLAPGAYVGVDINEEALQMARRRFPQHTFTTVIPHAKEFDTVVALAVIEHVKKPEDFLRDLGKHLKPGGRFVLTTPHPAFRSIHDAGASIGLFSHDASEEHETFLEQRDFELFARNLQLKLCVSERFLMGANQLFVLERL
jgi:2-polyprenyl-3-methyl-5-hydroxy-6-metoxy-1,4-benzoquinol methylase